jgi:hypothetical protein
MTLLEIPIYEWEATVRILRLAWAVLTKINVPRDHTWTDPMYYYYYYLVGSTVQFWTFASSYFLVT